jgi:hypothetical protein
MSEGQQYQILKKYVQQFGSRGGGGGGKENMLRNFNVQFLFAGYFLYILHYCCMELGL